MESETIIRAYLLEPGDIFKIGEIRYQVRNIENGRIYYWYLNWHARTESMGVNSREKLILITNKTKQNEHQNRSGSFSES